MFERFIAIGKVGIAPCPGTTNYTAYRVPAVPGSSVIAKNWNATRTRHRGSSMFLLSAGRGRIPIGRGRRGGWRDYFQNSSRGGGCRRRGRGGICEGSL